MEALAERRHRLLSTVHVEPAVPCGSTEAPPRARTGYAALRPQTGYAAARSPRTLELRASGGLPARCRGVVALPEPEEARGSAGSTISSRYKEMEQTSARLVEELERSDCEWRQCVRELESQLVAAERENARLRARLEARPQLDPGPGRGVGARSERRPEPPGRGPGYSRAAQQARPGSTGRACSPSPAAVDAGTEPCCREGDARVGRGYDERAAQLRSAGHFTTELTAALREVLHEPPVRLRRRSELLQNCFSHLS